MTIETPQAGPPVTQLPVVDTTKRGRGRPKGSRTRPDAPSRASRPASRTPATASRASLETRIGGLLVTANLVVMMVPGLGADALDAMEIAALAKAISEQAKQSPRFRRYIEAALVAGSGGQLIGVVLMIGARRASRHGILPPEVDGTIGMMMASNAGAPPAISHDG